MKISLALLILLLAAAWTGSQGMSFRSSRVKCCSKGMFPGKKNPKFSIPESKIQGYQDTPSSCTERAVLVKLKSMWVCVDPKEKWFKQYLKKQEKANSSST